jgi:hypothetical protein
MLLASVPRADAVSMRNLHNHNVDNLKVGGPDKAQNTQNCVNGFEENLPTTPKTPEAQRDQGRYRTVQCETSVTISTVRESVSPTLFDCFSNHSSIVRNYSEY